MWNTYTIDRSATRVSIWWYSPQLGRSIDIYLAVDDSSCMTYIDYRTQSLWFMWRIQDYLRFYVLIDPRESFYSARGQVPSTESLQDQVEYSILPQISLSFWPYHSITSPKPCTPQASSQSPSWPSPVRSARRQWQQASLRHLPAWHLQAPRLHKTCGLNSGMHLIMQHRLYLRHPRPPRRQAPPPMSRVHPRVDFSNNHRCPTSQFGICLYNQNNQSNPKWRRLLVRMETWVASSG